MKVNIKTIMAALGLTIVVAASLPQVPTTLAGPCANDGNFFLPTWYRGLCDDSKTTIESPVASNAANNGTVTGNSGANSTSSTKTGLTHWLVTLALNIVQIILTIVGYVSLGYIIYGGFKYMTQGDNSSGTVGARKTIQNAVIGLVISIMSVAIVTFVASRL